MQSAKSPPGAGDATGRATPPKGAKKKSERKSSAGSSPHKIGEAPTGSARPSSASTVSANATPAVPDELSRGTSEKELSETPAGECSLNGDPVEEILVENEPDKSETPAGESSWHGDPVEEILAENEPDKVATWSGVAKSMIEAALEGAQRFERRDSGKDPGWPFGYGPRSGVSAVSRAKPVSRTLLVDTGADRINVVTEQRYGGDGETETLQLRLAETELEKARMQVRLAEKELGIAQMWRHIHQLGEREKAAANKAAADKAA